MRIHETLGPEFLTAAIFAIIALTVFPHKASDTQDQPSPDVFAMHAPTENATAGQVQQ